MVDDQYCWYRKAGYINIQDNSVMNVKIVIFSKKTFTLYVGYAAKEEVVIETDVGEVTPFLDHNRDMYYYLTAF